MPRHLVNLRPAWIGMMIALIGCDAPIVAETSALACSNEFDDDEDGDTDCDDVDCRTSGVCETSVSTCQNGIDDDGNGLADCFDPRCQENPEAPCVAYETDCDPVTQTGCPAGMTCTPFETSSETIGCVPSTGSISIARLCEPDPTELSEPCRPGLVCTFGNCTNFCREDSDCLADSFCIVADDAVGLCTTPCTPNLEAACGDGFCASLGSGLGLAYFLGGGRYACFSQAVAELFDGTLEEGEECLDGSVAPSEVCRRGLVCVPNVDGTFVCRRGCAAGLVPSARGLGCDTCEECIPTYPTDLRDPMPDERISTPGFCECVPSEECSCD